MIQLVKKIPKAELHLHIEGTLQPKLMFKLSQKNKISMKYKSEQEVRAAYQFGSLQSFLDIYYGACAVLIEEEDFFELAWQYFLKCQQNNIKHSEIFFDPQSHTDRGVPFSNVIKGLRRAQEKAQKQLRISSYLIMCFLRHLDEESAFKSLEMSLPYKNWIIGVGLDSTQVGNPAQKFARVFQKAANQGFKLTSHAGEQGPAQSIWESLKYLGVKRIDHGVRCIEDQKLMQELKEKQITLTCCPLSNIATNVYKSMAQNNFKILLKRGLKVTINSDDPAYFNGYLNQNYIQLAQGTEMSQEDIKQAAINSFTGSYLPSNVIDSYVDIIKNI